ncbi:MAG: putative restriction endonuclease [Acidimicrobiaceae bacterium]|jgi:putative restriction endonuclease|nr:putative restriction endonuclease [Acidimicrobiaceae bacterium]
MKLAVEEREFDTYLRSAAFAFLDSVTTKVGGPVRYADVSEFVFDGQRIPLMPTQQGIRKPRQLSAALSFVTVHAARPDQRPYDDLPGDDGYLRYKWQGFDSNASTNVALREACREQRPLIWFQGIASGLYLPVYPVWLVDEEPAAHQFVVALDGEQADRWFGAGGIDLNARRRYAERTVRQRLHQPLFRARVLHAYENRCSICRLRHTELLDAAHISGDAEGGDPLVTNGIAMCKVHHAAFDHNLMGIRPDHRVEVRSDLLTEIDGPTLRYSFQELHGTSIRLPRQRAASPDAARLEERYQRFLEAG